MEYIGVDLHKRNFTACVIDGKGEVVHRQKYDNTSKDIISLLSLCHSKRPSFVIEATQNWMWMVMSLQDMDIPVTLAHPLRTKAIASARIKTDELDAATLAHLLRSDLVPKAYIPTVEERRDRDLVRARCQLVKQKTWVKNQIHSLLTKENVIYPHSDLFGKKGRDWLKSQPLPDNSELILNKWFELLVSIRSLISDLDKQIEIRSVDNKRVDLLKSIPGFGMITAFTLAAEIGDVKRFPSGKKMASYLGLVPSLYQSGKVKRQGRITKLGSPYARWILVQAAHRLVRSDVNTKLFYQTVSARRGKKKAVVAVSRKLAVLCWRLLTDNKKYISQPKRDDIR